MPGVYGVKAAHGGQAPKAAQQPPKRRDPPPSAPSCFGGSTGRGWFQCQKAPLLKKQGEVQQVCQFLGSAY